MKKKIIYVVIAIAVVVLIAYISGEKSSMSNLQHQLNQRVVVDIIRLQEDISDVNRAKKLSIDIAITDLGSLRLCAGALFSHLHEDCNWIASEYANSFNYLYHFSWCIVTTPDADLLGSEFQRFSTPLMSLGVDSEMSIHSVLQQLEDELLSEDGIKLLDELMFGYNK